MDQITGTETPKTISLIPNLVGSNNISSNKLLIDIQSKKKEMNKLLFCRKITKHSNIIKIAFPLWKLIISD